MYAQRLFAASATLALSLLGGQAFAEDGKAYPGSACQAQFDHVEATISRSNASILNAGSQRVKLFCPVAKDIEAGRDASAPRSCTWTTIASRASRAS